MKSVYVCENKLVELDDRLKKLFKGLRSGMKEYNKKDKSQSAAKPSARPLDLNKTRSDKESK